MRKVRFLSIVLITLSLLLSIKASSQPQNVKFNKLVHDFGDILLSSGEQKYTFIFQNTGSQAIIVQTVVSSCGCATPVWTKKPIMPNERGTIEVTFLNDQGPYPFDKALTAYISGEPRPVVLRIKGVVHEKAKPLSALFPQSYEGLSFRKSYIDLGNIAKGNSVTEIIEVANTTKSNLEAKFTPKAKGLTIKMEPSRLSPGQKGELHITLNSAEVQEWGKSRFLTQIMVNGRVVTNKELIITASIRDNFEGLTAKDREDAPLPMSQNSSYDFGKVKEGERVNTSFTLRNLGRRDLIIHKIECESSNVVIKHPHLIKPGTFAKIESTIDTAGEQGEVAYILTIITNSPSRPIMNLVLSGVVTK